MGLDVGLGDPLPWSGRLDGMDIDSQFPGKTAHRGRCRCRFLRLCLRPLLIGFGFAGILFFFFFALFRFPLGLGLLRLLALFLFCVVLFLRRLLGRFFLRRRFLLCLRFTFPAFLRFGSHFLFFFLGRVLLGVDFSDHVAHVLFVTFLNENLRDPAFEGRGNFNDRFIGFELDDGIIHLDLVAGFDQHIDDVAGSDVFADFGDFYFFYHCGSSYQGPSKN